MIEEVRMDALYALRNQIARANGPKYNMIMEQIIEAVEKMPLTLPAGPEESWPLPTTTSPKPTP